MRQESDNPDIYYNSIEYFQKLERSLAANLGLTELSSGIQVIRDKNGWRENEKSIAYSWIVQVSRSFVGWGGVFGIRFNENKFREYANKEEIIQGAYISNNNGIESLYTESSTDTSHEMIRHFNLNLFDANKGIALDGVSYKIRILASNIDTFIHVNNPNSAEWKKWESEIWTMGSRLAKDSNNKDLISLFE
ncbi:MULTISPECIES: hypothetical protein [Niastella]|uniref:Uncharacterized protein n=1 Tax=Niastella soli TaxID=2821487 RepID=A0ABS3Z277_9BACT|nr:hypothetical protein [Niastella soli]MBO9204234.1 hypothetical protein [Niastella soli]